MSEDHNPMSSKFRGTYQRIMEGLISQTNYYDRGVTLILITGTILFVLFAITVWLLQFYW